MTVPPLHLRLVSSNNASDSSPSTNEAMFALRPDGERVPDKGSGNSNNEDRSNRGRSDPIDDFDYTVVDPNEPSLEDLVAAAAQKAATEATAEAAAGSGLEETDDDLVPLDTIQIRPEDNVSRGGTMDGPDHPRVRLFAASLVSPDCGRLLEGLGLEALDAPVARPCGPYGHGPGQRPCCPSGAVGVHTLRLRYGFRRIVALRLARIDRLRRSRGEVVVHEHATPRQLDIMGGIENLFRDDPTHVQLAKYLVHAYRTHGLTVDQLVAATGLRTPTVESYMQMITRLPPDLIAVWRLRETPEVERTLARIAGLDADGRVHLRDEDRHAAMRAEWGLAEAARTREAAARAAGPIPQVLPNGGKSGGNSGPRQTTKRTLHRLAIEVDQAREVWDPTAGAWRPLDDRERDLLRAVFAYLHTPTTLPMLR